MDRRVLRSRRARPAAAGFTLVEVIVAMGIGIVVMLANLFLFSTAHRNLASSRLLTEATNLATRSLGGFRDMTIAQVEASAPAVDPPPNPLGIRRGTDVVVSGGTSFTRRWAVSRVDLEPDGVPDLVGDIVKIKIEVSWTATGGTHQVTMTTLTTGKPA